MAKGSSRGSSWAITRAAVLERDHHTCAYCGREADQVDHILAKANGGTDDMSNLIAACQPCNRHKSDKAIVRMSWVNKDWLASL